MIGLAPRIGLAMVAGWLGPSFATAAESTPFALQWFDGPAKPAVEVSGISAPSLATLERETRSTAQWATLLSVYAEPLAGAGNDRLPPVSGTWKVQGGKVRFEPQFPWSKGAHYRAVFQPAQLPGAPAGAASVISLFQLPADNAAPSATVLEVYPSAGVLPENLLKFYVQFSAPMSRGSIYEHIHLRDAAGQPVDLPFLDLNEELWDPTMTRLTLLVDPGRIKRGVKPLVDMGPVFEDGKSYSLEFDAAWLDAQGQPLRAAFRKDFRVGAADRRPPDPARWRLQAPAAGTREPLTIAFDEPMDRALASRLISVSGPGKAGVAGKSALADQEKQWSFVPDDAWPKGAYHVIVATTIEDLAGNNIGKVFDVDVFEEVQKQITTATVSLPFEIK